LADWEITELPQLAYPVVAAKYQRDTAVRIAVVPLTGDRRSIFDTVIAVTGCGDAEPDVPRVRTLVIARRLLVAVEVRRHEAGCTGQSSNEMTTVYLLDTQRGFHQALAYVVDSIDYGNPDDKPQRAPIYRRGYVYPNVCTERGCIELTAFFVGSGPKRPASYVNWRWNSDSTALVPLK